MSFLCRFVSGMLLGVMLFCIPVTTFAGTIPYVGTAVSVIGIVAPGSTPDRLRIAQIGGDTTLVTIVPGKTYVASPDLLHIGQSVKVSGSVSSSMDDVGLVADSVSSLQATAFDANQKHDVDKHRSTIRIVLGAAAGLLVGSGTYFLRHVFIHDAPSGQIPGQSHAASVSGTVSF